MEALTTKVLNKPDGTQLLVLPRLTLRVVEGPDRDQALELDQERVLIGTGDECTLRLTDPSVSRRHLEIWPSAEAWRVKDLQSTNGTLLGGIRLVEILITAPLSLNLGESTIQIAPCGELVEIPLSPRRQFGDVLGQSLAMRRIFAILERVAPSSSIILLTGESGTGKELTAQAIHQHSPRKDGPFVVVDCGAIPPTLIESELFGHQRGAFTGATETKNGAFAEADGGTLFLDEVSELSLELQPRLLRFIERQEVKRLGTTRHRKVDVRIIAATNARLANEVQQGRFRQDLFFRLSVVQIELPPLRERIEDIPLLATHLGEAFHRDPRAVITDEVAGLMASYHWPGNVRELRNMVERLSIMPELALQGLRGNAKSEGVPLIGPLTNLPFHEARRHWQDMFERQYLSYLLGRANGIVSQAASLAQLPRQTYHRLLRQHGLKGE